MGASLGLICSNRVSATLGGYVLIDGCRYIATSDHPITESQKTTNCDSGDLDPETVTHPSRHDLSEVEESLKRILLGMRSEIDREFREQYGDQDIPENITSDSPELNKALIKSKKLRSLLDEATKPKSEFAIGAVEKRSMGQRKASYPKSLAGVPGLENQTLTHQMDWCLCRATRDNSENRHRYRSNHDAELDNYLEESQNANNPEEVCYEMCDVESAAAICYVGQGSCHRDGKVSLPVTFMSKDGVMTHEWAIMSPLGEAILYPHVAGDSGAWVIRQNNNQLMGQIHSYANGMVLFTPSLVLFDDFRDNCGVEVSLPPCAPHTVHNPVVASAQQICSMPRTPAAQDYDFLLNRLGTSAHSIKPFLRACFRGFGVVWCINKWQSKNEVSLEMTAPVEEIF